MVDLKKNILVLLLDGCRSQSMGCYGYADRDTTPNIDALAKGGLVAQRNYSTSYCTMSSVVSMMTGVYPCLHKAANTWCYYDGKFPFLTDILRLNGYQTIGISNNIAAMSPELGFIRGYDRYYRVGKEQNWWKESKEEQRGVRKANLKTRSLRSMFKIFKKHAPELSEEVRRRSQISWYENHDMGGKKAVECFVDFLQTRDKEKPFFAYVNLPDTHHPYLVPKPYNNFWGNLNITDNLLLLMFEPGKFYDGYDLSSEEVETLREMYDMCVRYVDYLVGEILDILKQARMFENTVIVMVGDHGGMLYEKNQLYGSTCFTYEPEIRVPFIVVDHAPGRVKNVLTSGVDVFPTILDLADIQMETVWWNGKSLLQSDAGHAEVLIDYAAYPLWLKRRIKYDPEYLLRFGKTNRTLVTAEGEKFIWVDSGLYERYNLREDPTEQVNLFQGTEDDFVMLERMIQSYERLIGSRGRYLEYYPNNDIGEDFEFLPPLNIINPEFDPESIQIKAS